MYNIQLLNRISPSGLEVLDNGNYKYGDDIQSPDGIIVRSANMHEMTFGDNLRAIARAGAGTNNIPIDRCTEQGIVVFNTPGGNANAVKELTITALLISARKVFPGMQWVQTLKGQGEEVPKLVEKGKGQFAGPELKGKKLGVIGLGAIGIQVCNTASDLGMQIYGYDPYISVDAAWRINRGIKHAKSLKEIYQNCDFISIHVPLNGETRGMINSMSIAQMKDGVRIMNFSRGELVDSKDILAALDERKVYCYVTDFPNDDLLGHPGVLALPHLGASTPESEDNCAAMAASQLDDYLQNGNIRNSVNMPNVEADRSGRERICILHRNQPSLLSQITGAVGENINNMANNSRRDIAYTLLDIDGRITDAMVEKLKEIDGVVRVRVIR